MLYLCNFFNICLQEKIFPNLFKSILLRFFNLKIWFSTVHIALISTKINPKNTEKYKLDRGLGEKIFIKRSLRLIIHISWLSSHLKKHLLYQVKSSVINVSDAAWSLTLSVIPTNIYRLISNKSLYSLVIPN